MIRHATSASALALVAAGPALAHQGHEAAVVQGAAHWATQPDHWIVLALAALVAAEIGRRLWAGRVRDRRAAGEEDTGA